MIDVYNIIDEDKRIRRMERMMAIWIIFDVLAITLGVLTIQLAIIVIFQH